MKLILAEYINSLKEDGELDKVIQDILRVNGVEVFSKPEKGRQFGVDIYAVGKDFTDGNKRKVFLITVKQGDLDRRNWDAEVNSVRQSLDEIREVFVKNNLAPQHKKLPIKIVVAFNGLIKQSLQQNWAGYTNDHPKFEFALWQSDFLVEQFQEKMLNESGFSNNLRSSIRKTIIHLENRDYKLGDFVTVLDILYGNFKTATSKKAKIKVLKEMRLIVTIVIKYCDESDNLLHAINCSEKYILRLWSLLSEEDQDKIYVKEVIAGFHLHLETLAKYNTKLSFTSFIKDGLGKAVGDSLSYGSVVYEQIGILCEFGLFVLQLYEFVVKSDTANGKEMADVYLEKANVIATEAISIVNNNSIFYTPRFDDHLIEIHLLLMLLYKLGLKQQAADILHGIQNNMGEAYAYSRVFPVYRDLRIVAELESNSDIRRDYDYNSTYLFTILVEWSIVLNLPTLYTSFKILKDTLLKEITLLLWFPDVETQEKLYTENANDDSGYALSGIDLSDSMSVYKTILEEEYRNNCFEKDFTFIKESFWVVGLIASRHFRTHIFPYYWRSFLKD